MVALIHPPPPPLHLTNLSIPFPPSTDFMDKYINVYDSDAVELQYGTTTVYAEVKKESS